MPITIKYLPQPDIRPNGESGDERYKLFQDYTFSFSCNGVDEKFTITKGYKHDGASVPRIFMWLVGFERDGVHRAAALVHDWMYEHEGEIGDFYYNRKDADQLFLKGMEYHGIKSWHTRIAYITVRGLGWIKRRF